MPAPYTIYMCCNVGTADNLQWHYFNAAFLKKDTFTPQIIYHNNIIMVKKGTYWKTYSPFFQFTLSWSAWKTENAYIFEINKDSYRHSLFSSRLYFFLQYRSFMFLTSFLMIFDIPSTVEQIITHCFTTVKFISIF